MILLDVEGQSGSDSAGHGVCLIVAVLCSD